MTPYLPESRAAEKVKILVPQILRFESQSVVCSALDIVILTPQSFSQYNAVSERPS